MADTDLMKVKEVAEYLRVSEMMVYRLCESGELVSIKIGRHIRIKREDLEEYINRQREGSGEG